MDVSTGDRTQPGVTGMEQDQQSDSPGSEPIVSTREEDSEEDDENSTGDSEGDWAEGSDTEGGGPGDPAVCELCAWGGRARGKYLACANFDSCHRFRHYHCLHLVDEDVPLEGCTYLCFMCDFQQRHPVQAASQHQQAHPTLLDNMDDDVVLSARRLGQDIPPKPRALVDRPPQQAGASLGQQRPLLDNGRAALKLKPPSMQAGPTSGKKLKRTEAGEAGVPPRKKQKPSHPGAHLAKPPEGPSDKPSLQGVPAKPLGQPGKPTPGQPPRPAAAPSQPRQLPHGTTATTAGQPSRPSPFEWASASAGQPSKPGSQPLGPRPLSKPGQAPGLLPVRLAQVAPPQGAAVPQPAAPKPAGKLASARGAGLMNEAQPAAYEGSLARHKEMFRNQSKSVFPSTAGVGVAAAASAAAASGAPAAEARKAGVAFQLPASTAPGPRQISLPGQAPIARGQAAKRNSHAAAGGVRRSAPPSNPLDGFEAPRPESKLGPGGASAQLDNGNGDGKETADKIAEVKLWCGMLACLGLKDPGDRNKRKQEGPVLKLEATSRHPHSAAVDLYGSLGDEMEGEIITLMDAPRNVCIAARHYLSGAEVEHMCVKLAPSGIHKAGLEEFTNLLTKNIPPPKLLESLQYDRRHGPSLTLDEDDTKQAKTDVKSPEKMAAAAKSEHALEWRMNEERKHRSQEMQEEDEEAEREEGRPTPLLAPGSSSSTPRPHMRPREDDDFATPGTQGGDKKSVLSHGDADPVEVPDGFAEWKDQNALSSVRVLRVALPLNDDQRRHSTGALERVGATHHLSRSTHLYLLPWMSSMFETQAPGPRPLASASSSNLAARPGMGDIGRRRSLLRDKRQGFLLCLTTSVKHVTTCSQWQAPHTLVNPPGPPARSILAGKNRDYSAMALARRKGGQVRLRCKFLCFDIPDLKVFNQEVKKIGEEAAAAYAARKARHAFYDGPGLRPQELTEAQQLDMALEGALTAVDFPTLLGGQFMDLTSAAQVYRTIEVATAGLLAAVSPTIREFCLPSLLRSGLLPAPPQGQAAHGTEGRPWQWQLVHRSPFVTQSPLQPSPSLGGTPMFGSCDSLQVTPGGLQSLDSLHRMSGDGMGSNTLGSSHQPQAALPPEPQLLPNGRESFTVLNQLVQFQPPLPQSPPPPPLPTQPGTTSQPAANAPIASEHVTCDNDPCLSSLGPPSSTEEAPQPHTSHWPPLPPEEAEQPQHTAQAPGSDEQHRSHSTGGEQPHTTGQASGSDEQHRSHSGGGEQPHTTGQASGSDEQHRSHSGGGEQPHFTADTSGDHAQGQGGPTAGNPEGGAQGQVEPRTPGLQAEPGWCSGSAGSVGSLGQWGQTEPGWSSGPAASVESLGHWVGGSHPAGLAPTSLEAQDPIKTDDILTGSLALLLSGEKERSKLQSLQARLLEVEGKPLKDLRVLLLWFLVEDPLKAREHPDAVELLKFLARYNCNVAQECANTAVIDPDAWDVVLVRKDDVPALVELKGPPGLLRQLVSSPCHLLLVDKVLCTLKTNYRTQAAQLASALASSTSGELSAPPVTLLGPDSPLPCELWEAKAFLFGAGMDVVLDSRPWRHLPTQHLADLCLMVWLAKQRWKRGAWQLCMRQADMDIISLHAPQESLAVLLDAIELGLVFIIPPLSAEKAAAAAAAARPAKHSAAERREAAFIAEYNHVLWKHFHEIRHAVVAYCQPLPVQPRQIVPQTQSQTLAQLVPTCLHPLQPTDAQPSPDLTHLEPLPFEQQAKVQVQDDTLVQQPEQQRQQQQQEQEQQQQQEDTQVQQSETHVQHDNDSIAVSVNTQQQQQQQQLDGTCDGDAIGAISNVSHGGGETGPRLSGCKELTSDLHTPHFQIAAASPIASKPPQPCATPLASPSTASITVGAPAPPSASPAAAAVMTPITTTGPAQTVPDTAECFTVAPISASALAQPPIATPTTACILAGAPTRPSASTVTSPAATGTTADTAAMITPALPTPPAVIAPWTVSDHGLAKGASEHSCLYHGAVQEVVQVLLLLLTREELSLPSTHASVPSVGYQGDSPAWGLAGRNTTPPDEGMDLDE